VSSIRVVIVSYNVRDLLESCIRSLDAVVGHELQIWVIDNASADGTADMIREHFPGIRLVCCDSNLGFAVASNLALREIDTDYVVLLNPDTVVLPGALEAMASCLESEPRAAAVGAQLVSVEGALQTSHRRFPTFTSVARSLLRAPRPMSQDDHDLGVPGPVDWVVGACLMTTPRVLREVGVLDETFFLYSEELEWCWRVWRGHGEVWHVPEARVVHVHGASARSGDPSESVSGNLALHHYYRSEFLYFVKIHGPAAALGVYVLRRSALAAGIVKRTLRRQPEAANDRRVRIAAMRSIRPIRLLADGEAFVPYASRGSVPRQ
jgi:N-acetylglucosaminyl-diphospho-decaprenol L-rhamnosyltransferase